MSKYQIEVIANKTVDDFSPYSYEKKKRVSITKAELYEAVSKYLQVKGFDTEKVAVTEIEED